MRATASAGDGEAPLRASAGDGDGGGASTSVADNRVGDEAENIEGETIEAAQTTLSGAAFCA